MTNNPSQDAQDFIKRQDNKEDLDYSKVSVARFKTHTEIDEHLTKINKHRKIK